MADNMNLQNTHILNCWACKSQVTFVLKCYILTKHETNKKKREKN